jgi:5'(3')-deoxyribonucleotidase
MKRIAVDMDGVLASVFDQYIKYHYAETGELKTIKDGLGKTELEPFPHGKRYLHSKGFFRTLPVIPGSREVLEKLTNHYEVFIVSSATEFPQCLPEKQAWLNEYFPFIGWEQMVFCGVKTIIQADIMIDDHFKNLDPFPGKTLLFNQPHNQLAHDGRHTRVFNWMEIDDLLLNGVSLDNRWLLDKTA